MKVPIARSTGVRLASVGLVLMLTACDRESVNPTESGSDLGPALETSQAVVPGPGERVRVDVIFRGKPPASLADEEVLSEFGASVVYRYRLIRGLTIDIPEEAIPALEMQPAVVKVGRPGATFAPTGDAKSWEKLNPKYGHDFDDPIVDPSSGAKIVVAGTGIQCNNSDLDCTGGRSFAADGSPWDQDGAGGNGHETGVASIIAAEHNGVGRFGWAAGAFLYSGRVHDQNLSATCSGIGNMIDWAAVDVGAHIINMSFSEEFTPEFEDECPSLRPITDSAAHNYGVIMVASSGNISNNTGPYPDSVGYPARYPNVTAVGGVWCGSENGSSCAFKARWWDDAAYGSQLEMVATAHKVRLLKKGSTGTWLGDGTSFAAPMVSAAAALVLQEYPECVGQPVPVRSHLRSHAYEPANGPTGLEVGHGVLDVAAALADEPSCLLLG